MPNSEPSFFKPWSFKLTDHPVDADAMKGDSLEALDIGDPIHSNSNPVASERQIRLFIFITGLSDDFTPS